MWPELAEPIHALGNVIEMMAVLILAYASFETFVVTIRLVVSRRPFAEGRPQWLRFLILLVIGLTFQLAADLVHLAIATGWEPLGRAVVIAVLRTFLAYFLGRDLREARELNERHAA